MAAAPALLLLPLAQNLWLNLASVGSEHRLRECWRLRGAAGWNTGALITHNTLEMLVCSAAGDTLRPLGPCVASGKDTSGVEENFVTPAAKLAH